MPIYVRIVIPNNNIGMNDQLICLLVEAIRDHGYTEQDLLDLRPCDIYESFGIEVTDTDLNRAVNAALDKCC